MCITFPRSGHHLLVVMIIRYFSSEEIPIENASNSKDHKFLMDFEKLKESLEDINGKIGRIDIGNFHYCEFYKHLQTIPCPDRIVNFQKCHDFDLDVPTNLPGHGYIIQYRNPIYAITSWYKTGFKRGWLLFEDTYEQWEIFAYEKIEFWKKFVQKWLINNPSKPSVTVDYDCFLQKPEKYIEKILKVTDLDPCPDKEKIHLICKEEKIEIRSSLEDFKYYDEGFFKKLEKKVWEEMKAIGMKNHFD